MTDGKGTMSSKKIQRMKKPEMKYILVEVDMWVDKKGKTKDKFSLQPGNGNRERYLADQVLSLQGGSTLGPSSLDLPDLPRSFPKPFW